MQEPFYENEDFLNFFRATLSEARFSRYLQSAGGEVKNAVRLYQWNALLSQSLYLPMQAWEIALRNRLNSFLCWKYNHKWPFDDRLTRQLKGHGFKKLKEALERQQQAREMTQVPTDMIVADLSAGFWVSLLSSGYDIPFSFRYNIKRVFPCNTTIDRARASDLCNGLLDLRNRVAHHEPVYHWLLSRCLLVSAICSLIDRVDGDGRSFLWGLAWCDGDAD